MTHRICGTDSLPKKLPDVSNGVRCLACGDDVGAREAREADVSSWKAGNLRRVSREAATCEAATKGSAGFSSGVYWARGPRERVCFSRVRACIGRARACASSGDGPRRFARRQWVDSQSSMAARRRNRREQTRRGRSPEVLVRRRKECSMTLRPPGRKDAKKQKKNAGNGNTNH